MTIEQRIADIEDRLESFKALERPPAKNSGMDHVKATLENQLYILRTIQNLRDTDKIVL